MVNFIKELEAICAETITDPKTFKKFDRLLTTDFVNIVGKNYNVITIHTEENNDFIYASKSKYIYVFDEPVNVRKIKKNELQSIIHLTNEISVASLKMDLRKLDYQRLENFEKRGLILLTRNTNNDIIEVRLTNCILIIRLADHELGYKATDQQIRSFNMRKNLVDSLHYYNIDEVQKEFELKINENVYCTVFKRGKERIIYEFTEKMRNAGLTKTIIDEVIRKLSNIF